MQNELGSNAWDYTDFWKNFREPARPNPSEIEILASYIKPQQKVLILGSTPEYRDLCAAKNAQVTIVDYDKATYQNLSKLMRQSSKIHRQTTIKHRFKKTDPQSKIDLAHKLVSNFLLQETERLPPWKIDRCNLIKNILKSEIKRKLLINTQLLLILS